MNDNTPTFVGTGEPGATVVLYNGTGAALGTGVVDGSGNWTITSVALPDGTQTFSATQTDPAGNTSSASTVTITIDTVAPIISINTPLTGQLRNP